MAKIEIDEEEARQLVGLRGVASKIYSNPKARVLLEQAHKLVDPNAKTPALDEQNLALEPVRAVEKKFEEFVAKTEKEKAEDEQKRKTSELVARHNAGIAELRTKHKYTDEGIKAVEKLMEEKGILDPLDAAAIFERDHPPQAPVTPGGSGSWNFMDVPVDGGDKFVKDLIASKGQNDSLVEREAMNTIHEVRGSPRR